MICMYELKKDPNEVTEAEWVKYFLQSCVPVLEDYSAVDAAMKSLRMDPSVPDAVPEWASCVLTCTGFSMSTTLSM